MLPFLKNRTEGSASDAIDTLERTPDDGDADFGALDAVAEDILMAIEKKDVTILKEALSALVAHIQDMDTAQDEAAT